MSWVVRYGALSGGGFVQGITFADDGTMAINYDGSNCWRREGSQFENLFAQDRMPEGSAQEQWGQGFNGGGGGAGGENAPAIAIAPSDSDRMYVAATTTANSGFGPTEIWRMDAFDGKWIKTGFGIGLAVSSLRGAGPTLAVDPANPDHVLFSDDAGAIWRTTDAFETITCLNATGGPLAGVLPSAVTNGATAPGNGTLHFGSGTIPAEVVTPASGFSYWMSDVSDNLAIQLSVPVASTTATTAVGERTLPGTADGVETGDTIVFGMRACIAFDRSSSVVGGITQGVYIGWMNGTDAVYHSDDGCATFDATVDGPEHVMFLACSHDGVVYVCPYEGTSLPATHPWRYQSATWTELTDYDSFSGNNWTSLATDPTTAGKVAFVQAAGAVFASPDYGATFGSQDAGAGYDANYNLISGPRVSTSVPWMGPYVIPDGDALHGTLENSMTNGQCAFDPIVSGRLWIVEGIGAWYCQPATSGTDNILTFNGFNKNQQTIILNQLVKAPGGVLLASCQDRAGFRLADPAVEPSGQFGFYTGPLSPLTHGWGIDYAKDDKDFLILTITGGTYKSTDEGLLWTLATADAGFQSACACQTSTNFVIFPNSGSPIYTTDGGTTMLDCSFGGSPLTSGWGGFFFNRKMVCADLVDPDTYYAYNYNNDATGGLWRSTDGGDNWTRMCTKIPHPTEPGIFMNSGAVDFMLTAVQGHEGHLLIGPGSAFNNGFPVMWSVDAGANWIAIPGSGDGSWLACAGKERSGAAYPAVYMAGFCTTDDDPDDAGMFVTADLDPEDVEATPTWERICRAPAGNMDGAKSLVADKDRYGRWFMSSGGTGYAYGVGGSSVLIIRCT